MERKIMVDRKTKQQATDDLRHFIINEVIGIEGCYVDDPIDSGGKTKYGITEYIAKNYGINVKDLTEADAFHIYKVGYWDKLSLDNIVLLSPLIAQELFDTKVNLGNSAKFFQRCLNVLNKNGQYYPDLVVDGAIGPATLSAFRAYFKRRDKTGETVLFNMLNSLQGNHYIQLAERRAKDEKFIFGWFKNRVIITNGH